MPVQCGEINVVIWMLPNVRKLLFAISEDGTLFQIQTSGSEYDGETLGALAVGDVSLYL